MKRKNSRPRKGWMGQEDKKMGKLDEYFGNGKEMEIDGVKFFLPPLSIEDMPDFFKAMKGFAGAKADAPPEEVFKNITDESTDAIRRLVMKTIDLAMPDDTKENRSRFALRHLMVIFPEIFEYNMAVQPKDI